LLDNLWVAHGRMPYKGKRLVLTSLIEGVKKGEVAPPPTFPHIEMEADPSSRSSQSEPPTL